MNGLKMPFGDVPSTTSVDMPPGLEDIMRRFPQAPPVMPNPMGGQAASPMGIQSNLGIGAEMLGGMRGGSTAMTIPSYQEGGEVEEPNMRQEFMDEAARRISAGGITGWIPNPINSLKALANIRFPTTANEKNYPSPNRPGSPGYKPSPIPRDAFGGPGVPFSQGPFIAQDSYGRMTTSGFDPTSGGTYDPGSQLNSPKLPGSFAEGGMVGNEGMRIPAGAVPGMPMPGSMPMQAGVSPEMQAGTPMAPQMLQMQLNQFASQHPQQMAQIRQAIVEEMQTGELTPQELNMIVQLATVAAQNPEMYANVRNFAIQQGIATETDLPAQYDQGLVFVLLLAARAVQQDLGGAPAEAGQPPGSAAPVIPSMAAGGKVPSSSDSKPVLIEAHTGEYVIPKHVVDMKGKEFFDSLVEKYKGSK
jgi:hypothetical protein